MADKKTAAPRRLNRTVGVGEALGKVLDPALKKRGFATRDIITHWAEMAPAPYDRMARPERLAWPRGARGADGATLYLCCHAGHALALSHEGQRVAAAINRYFGYFLVGQVRLSAEPFVVSEAPEAAAPDPAEPERQARVGEMVAGVEDPQMREALRLLGEAVARRARR